jgi:hypothetical protein
MKRAILMVATLALLFGGAGRARADLVTNGGFETGDFTGWTQGGNMSLFLVEPANGDLLVPHTGTYFALLTSGLDGTLSQTLTTTVGQTYQLSFYLVTDGTNVNDFSANVGGPNLITLTNLSQMSYVNYTADFKATSSSTTLTLAFFNLGFFALDDVSVNAVSAVPEPSGIALLGLGVICLAAGYVVRRKTLLQAAA